MASSIRSKAVALFSIAAICVSLLSLLSFHLLPSYARLDPVLRLPSEIFGPRLEAGGDDSVGTRWAILIAGSSGYRNHRHQEDNCLPFKSSAVSQRDADIVYYWLEFCNSPEGSSKKLDAQKELLDIMTHRMHVDKSINLIGKLLFGLEKGIEVLSAVRPTGQPLVDDWACLKSMVRIFETHCGSLSEYGMKYYRSFANICNAGINNETMAKVSGEVCIQIPSTRRSSLRRGFNAWNGLYQGRKAQSHATWNIRGFNNPDKIFCCKNLVREYDLDMFCLLENIILLSNLDDPWFCMTHTVFNNEMSYNNFELASSGRSWIKWNATKISFSPTFTSSQMVTGIIAHGSQSLILISVIYASTTFE
ncbi:hypothetical protein M5K25_022546 [Dendrobium thyrsiflorum]|uniref:Legumain prodomain domain-containing protein n=1 Tax=Dendrobium thyrsiflorum TaxID=117978 RepID=A0ABD0UCI8_DENTH